MGNKNLPESARRSNLTDSDFETLRRSFITPELAAQAGLYRVSNAEGAELVGRKTEHGKSYAGIVFPYFDPVEDGRHVESRLRRDKPDLERNPDGTTKQTAKYLSPPGRRNLLYFPPGTTAGDILDASLPVIIVEGEKKTLAVKRFLDEAGRRGLVVGLGGVTAWSARVGTEPDQDGKPQPVKGMNERLARIAWEGRDVTIIFDSNVTTNEGVFWARHGLAKKLTERGAKVFYVDVPELPGVNGPDDLLFQKGAGFLEALLLSRQPAFKRDVKNPTTDGPTTPKPTRGRLMKADELASLPPPEWLIQDIALPKNDVCVLFGPPGSGKTFAASDIAFSVSQAVPVVYIAAEAVGTLQSRVEAWKTFHKRELPNLYFWTDAVNLLDMGAVGEFIGEIGDVKPALVVVDTLARCMVGGDENSSKDMGLAVESLDLIRRATGAAVLVVHHTRKSGDSERGSTALRGAAHTMISLSNDDGLITLKCDKNRGGPDFDPLYFRFVEAGSPELVVPIRSAKVEMKNAPLTQRQMEILSGIKSHHYSNGATHAELVQVMPGILGGTLSKALRRFQDLGLVSENKRRFTITENGRWILEHEDARDMRRSASASVTTLNWTISLGFQSDSVLSPSLPKPAENEQMPDNLFPLEKGDVVSTVSTEFPGSFQAVSAEFPPKVSQVVSIVSTPPIGGGKKLETETEPKPGNEVGQGDKSTDSASQTLRTREAVEFVERERRDKRTDDAIRERSAQFGISRADLKRAFEILSTSVETNGKRVETTPPSGEGGNEKAVTGGRKRVRV